MYNLIFFTEQSTIDSPSNIEDTFQMAEKQDDSFTLYDLQVETVKGDRDFVCAHEEGVNFQVIGENLVFHKDSAFSLYALSALLPLLPSKQRVTDKNDWMTTDTDIACPDPNCGARFRITRINRRTFSHADCTVVPLDEEIK